MSFSARARVSGVLKLFESVAFTRPLVAWGRGRLGASALLRAVLTLAGGGVAAQSLSIVTAPITTRIFAVGDYGMAGVLGSVCSILCIVATFRLEMAIALPREEGKARRIVFGSLLLACASSAITAVLAWTCGAWVFARLGAPELYRYWWVLPASLLGNSAYNCLYYWALRRKAYMLLTKTRFQQALGGAVITIGVGLLCKGPLGLFLGTLAGGSLGISLLGKGLPSRAFARGVARCAWESLRSVGAYRRFAAFATGATLLNSFGTTIPPLLFAAFYGKEVVGSLGLAQRLITLPMVLFGTAVAQVFLAEAAELVRERPAEVPAFFRRVSRKMVLPALGLLCLGAVCPFAYPIVFGPPWQTAGLYAAMLSVSCAAQLIVSPIATIAILRQRQDIQFALDAVRMVAVVLAVWLPSRYAAGGGVAVGCFAAVMTVLYGVYYLAYLRLAQGCARSVPAAQRPAP